MFLLGNFSTVVCSGFAMCSWNMTPRLVRVIKITHVRVYSLYLFVFCSAAGFWFWNGRRSWCEFRRMIGIWGRGEGRGVGHDLDIELKDSSSKGLRKFCPRKWTPLDTINVNERIVSPVARKKSVNKWKKPYNGSNYITCTNLQIFPVHKIAPSITTV